MKFNLKNALLLYFVGFILSLVMINLGLSKMAQFVVLVVAGFMWPFPIIEAKEGKDEKNKE